MVTKRKAKTTAKKPVKIILPTFPCPLCGNISTHISKIKNRPDRKKYYIICNECKKDSIVHIRL